jgi:hypothetical protein
MMTTKMTMSKNDEYDSNQLDEILKRNGSTLSSRESESSQDSRILESQSKLQYEGVKSSEGSFYQDGKSNEKKEHKKKDSRTALHRDERLRCINGKYVVQGEINVNGIYGKIALTLSDNWHILEVLHQTSLQKLHSTREIDA